MDVETVTGAIETGSADGVAIAERTFDLLATQAAYGDDARAILNRTLSTHTAN